MSKSLCQQATSQPASDPDLSCDGLTDWQGFALAILIWTVIFCVLWRMGCFGRRSKSEDWWT